MSTLLFLVDECLPADVTLALRGRGADVADLFERGLRGLRDEEVWALAAVEGRILVSRDLDFPLRGIDPKPPGLVLIRAPDGTTAPGLAALALSLLDAVPAPNLAGFITVVSPGRYRQRAW